MPSLPNKTMMKKAFRFIALLLCLTTVFSCISCSQIETQETAETHTAEKAKKPKNEKKPSVPNPLTWEKINSIPVASPEMSVDQLRQICVDYFRLQLSYQWTPEESFTYTIASNGNTVRVQKGTVYGGHLYVTNAVSNLYRMMNYYD